jgi:hypothetical protein
MPTPKSTLSKFILSLPATLSGSQVVAQAKAKGMKTSRANVSRVRGLYGVKAGKTAATKVTAPSAAKPVAPATSKPTPPSKSDFIRSQPATLSPAEVVAKGKEKGILFSDSLVYMVRAPATAKTGTSKKASAPAKSATPKTPTKPPKSKADFVRAHSTLSPKEVVEKAKAEGVKFDVRYVYRVRGLDKATTKAKRSAVKPTISTPAAANGAQPLVASAGLSSATEDLLRAVAAELGLGRAVEILSEERARVRAVIGG